MDLKRKNYQRNSSWNAPYTFSGKEKDVETGYGYFGARYYDSGLSIWLSVDPMSDKYPSMSPYNYCANNPVILVDPDGREFVNNDDKALVTQMYQEYDEKIKKYNYELSSTTDESRKTELNTYIQEMKNAKTELADMEQSKQKYTFNFTNDNDGKGKTTYDKTNNTVVMTVDNVLSFDVVAHELKHGSQFERKELSFTSNGEEGGHLYDITDEYVAYERNAAFSDFRYNNEEVNKHYSVLANKKPMELSITPKNKGLMNRYLNSQGDIYNKR
jgi:RHS repeat-associated protein